MLDLDYYDWDRVQDFHEDIFGAAQVRVVPMELMLSDTAAARRAGKARARALIEAHLGDRFVASNRQFAARNGYDLAALGYKV